MHDDLRALRGAGGDKGSEQRTAVEAQDSLYSIQYAEILDLICEGEVKGLVDGARSIYLDDTPLQNQDGSYNFNNVSWAFVPGTQNQPALPGFSEPGGEVSVAVEVRAAVPVVRTINSPADAVRVTLHIPQFSLQDLTNGDLNGTSVAIEIQVQSRDAFGNPGGFVTVKADTISGKTMSLYPRSYRIPLTGHKPWDIRVKRLTPDATVSHQVDKIYWASYSLISETSLSYPNSAVVGVRLSTKNFKTVPQRSYDMYLQKMWVPTNYNPETRTYSGLWDGTFKYEWSDNPAWVWYDLATHPRYGLGGFIPKESVDIWSLYEIAQYCDQLVSDGYGGVEPRFRCNIYLQTRQEALKVLQDIAGVFRGAAFWAASAIVPVADKPRAASKLFSAANVIDGKFSYSGTARTARHTIALVAWNDPGDAYKQKIEYVPDDEGIARYGVLETEVVAIGSTSRGQAWRVGKHILATELAETEVVTFKTGLEGCGLYPGAVFKTLDAHRSGQRHAGRVRSATTSTVTLDAPVTLEPGRSYTLSAVLPDGTIEDRGVLWSGTASTEAPTLGLAAPLSAAPQPESMWILAADNLVPEQWRTLSIKEVSETTLEIVGLAYKPEKYAEIDNGVILQAPPTTTLPLTQAPVTNIKVTPSVVTLANGVTNRLIVSWDVPARGAQYYRVQWSKDSENPVELQPTAAAINIDDALPGLYKIRVVAVSALGRLSPAAILDYTYTSAAPAAGVTGLALFAPWDTPDVSVVWDSYPAALSYRIEVRAGTSLLSSHRVTAPTFTYSLGQNIKDGGARRSVTIAVRPVTPLGLGTGVSEITVTNPQLAAPSGITTRPGVGSLTVGTTKPSARDYAGTIVAVSQNAGFSPAPANYAYNGPDTGAVVTGLVPGATYYVRIAQYDTLGQDSLAWSSELSVTTQSVSGIPNGTSLPASPDDIGGSNAFFLDVANAATRGLYGWDGTSWKSTRDGANLVADSVTATQVSGQLLQGMTAKLGELETGKLTVDASGYFRAGADSYWSSAGFWVGRIDGKYKLSMKGTNGGLRFDGDKVEILDAAGAVLLASHQSLGVGWSNITGVPADVYNSSITVSGGALQGIGAGAGTVVDNAAVPPGGNMLPNSDLSAALAPWVLGWNQNNWPSVFIGRDYAGADWTPSGGHQVGVHRSGVATGVQDFYNSAPVPVEAGKRYEISGYVANHRGRCRVGVKWRKIVNGTEVVADPQEHWSTLNVGATGGRALKDWERLGLFATAPADATFAYFVVRQEPTGESDPYTWLTRAYLGRAAPNQTTFSEWSPAGVLDARQLGYTGHLNATQNTFYNGTTDPGSSLGSDGLWYNPSNRVLLRRNAANTGWEDFATYGATFGDSSGNGRNVNGQITASNIGIYMAGAAITNAYIGNTIQSDNYVPGSTGWLLQKNGTLELNDILSRGSFFSLGGDVGIQKIGGWGVFGSLGKWWGDGNSGFVFARASDGGSFLDVKAGSNLLRLSSWNDSRMTLATNGGKVLLNFSSSEGIAEFGGTMRADAIDAVNTINIAGQAVTTSVNAVGSNSNPVTVTVSVPAGAAVVVLVSADIRLNYGGATMSGGSGAPNWWIDILRGDSAGNNLASITKSGASFSSGLAAYTVLDTPSAGTYTYRFETGLFQGTGGSSASVATKRLVVLIAKR